MSEQVHLLTIVGTRPEVLKLAPVVARLRSAGERLATRVCFSGQHRELAADIAREVGLSPDFDLPGDEGPFGLTAALSHLLRRLEAVIGEARPSGVLVQGDTNTALAGALAAFHRGVPVFHVEAGLRTSNPARPFPEEMNRRLVTRIAALHFAPTEHARRNLLAEGVPAESVVVTGNTIVESLSLFGGATPGAAPEDGARPRVLVTLHRRENCDAANGVSAAVRELCARGDMDVIWLRHPNATSQSALAALDDIPSLRVLDPQPYGEFIALLRGARAVLTDSGGVQEEAPVLGVPVVVLRNETDRPEAVETGNAVVVGSDPAAIVRACAELLDDPARHAARSARQSPFGDGHAAERIVAALERYFFP